ncbi:MAG: peptidylprolyl isomerase [Mariniblastus sp.]
MLIVIGMMGGAVSTTNGQLTDDSENQAFQVQDQGDTKTVDDGVSPVQLPQRTLQELLADIRANEKNISFLFSSIPIGFPEKQRQQMDRIRAKKAKNLELKVALADAAAIAYKKDPTDSVAARIVYSTLANKIDAASGVRFDPSGALELADMMFKSGLQPRGTGNDENRIPGLTYEAVAYQAFRASFAIQDYGRAEMMLQRIEEGGTKLLPVYREALTDAKEKWKRELMIRRLESNTNDLPQIKIETTEGNIVVELFENHAPQTVGNFVSLVQEGFYDDKAFYLVRPGDCARTGCSENDGTGDIGYQIPCEYNREQIRHHFSGTLSMHNEGPDTGGSQFFITHQRKKEYDGRYTAFGRVIDGMDVVYKLNKVDKTPYSRIKGGEASKIIKATVLRKREHPYGPSRVADQTRTARDGG